MGQNWFMMDGGSQAEIRAGKRCFFLCLRMVEEGGRIFRL